MEDDPMNNIPHLFRCPISLDFFTDPVTLCTGQTYDRSNIEKWLSAGNLTCPVTMQKLHDPSLVPNHTLKHLIQHWISINDRQVETQHLASIEPSLPLAAFRHILESQESTFTTRLETLGKIRTLSQEIGWRRSFLVQLGFFPLLLKLLFGSSCHTRPNLSQEDLQFAEQALDCVVNLLPFVELSSFSMLEESSHLASFLVLLKQGNVKIKTALCNLVGAIALSSETRELCLVLGKSEYLLRELVALLRENNEASEAGCKAISALSSVKPIQENVVRAGGMDGILWYLSSSNKQHVSMALTTLDHLLELGSAKEALVDNPDGIKILVKMVFKVSDHEGSERALSLLLILCSDSLSVREEAICQGVLTQILLLLQSQNNSRVKSKAMMLLKLLRSMPTKEPTKPDPQCSMVDV